MTFAASPCAASPPRLLLAAALLFLAVPAAAQYREPREQGVEAQEDLRLEAVQISDGLDAARVNTRLRRLQVPIHRCVGDARDNWLYDLHLAPSGRVRRVTPVPAVVGPESVESACVRRALRTLRLPARRTAATVRVRVRRWGYVLGAVRGGSGATTDILAGDVDQGAAGRLPETDTAEGADRTPTRSRGRGQAARRVTRAAPVQVGAARVRGDLAAQAVTAVLRRRLGALRRCHERALPETPNVAGRIAFDLRIASNGTLDRVIVDDGSDPFARGPVGECVRRQLLRLRFPAPADGRPARASVDLTFRLAD